MKSRVRQERKDKIFYKSFQKGTEGSRVRGRFEDGNFMRRRVAVDRIPLDKAIKLLYNVNRRKL